MLISPNIFRFRVSFLFFPWPISLQSKHILLKSLMFQSSEELNFYDRLRYTSLQCLIAWGIYYFAEEKKRVFFFFFLEELKERTWIFSSLCPQAKHMAVFSPFFGATKNQLFFPVLIFDLDLSIALLTNSWAKLQQFYFLWNRWIIAVIMGYWIIWN